MRAVTSMKVAWSQGALMAKVENLEQLVAATTCAAVDVPTADPSGPGYYAIFVKEARALPSPYRERLKQHSTTLIYIGIAEKSLFKRLVEQDLRGKGHSTFF